MIARRVHSQVAYLAFLGDVNYDMKKIFPPSFKAWRLLEIEAREKNIESGSAAYTEIAKRIRQEMREKNSSAAPTADYYIPRGSGLPFEQAACYSDARPVVHQGASTSRMSNAERRAALAIEMFGEGSIKRLPRPRLEYLKENVKDPLSDKRVFEIFAPSVSRQKIVEKFKERPYLARDIFCELCDLSKTRTDKLKEVFC